MTEDFPDDSLFRSSNVAMLDAKDMHGNDNSKLKCHPHVEMEKTDDIHTSYQDGSLVLKFTTAKHLLDSLKTKGSSKIEEDVTKNLLNLLERPKTGCSVLKSELKTKDKVKCGTVESSSKISKTKTENKDRVKLEYRPLNITRNVPSCSKLSQDLIEDDPDLFLCKGDHNKEPDDLSTLSITTQEKLQLESWGLPHNILHQYARRGITTMFPWQVECLCSPRVLNGGNLVYSAPTSAGKTLVAEIICIKTILERHKKALFILPFISVVREKMYYFQELLRGSGVRVDGFMGGHSPPGGFRAIDLAICTIEKANSLINRLLEEEKLADIGAVIVDELHLIGDSHRGYLLELLLTKLKFMSLKEQSVHIQVVGMSATLPNLSLLSTWLDADLYKTRFRPVPLEEFVKIGRVIYDKNMHPVRNVKPEIEIKDDTEDIVYLCLESIVDGHSVLIFCPTKNWCESLAQTIAAQFKSIGLQRDISAPESLPYKLREQLNSSAIVQALEQLQRCPVGLDNILKKVVSFGVAFHHAGLTMDERDIVEGSFRNGALRVLVATSTLSSGVNLPARRVIIRTPMFHGHRLDVLAYQQMVGRAGRMGVDSAGESILVCQTVEKRIAENLLSGSLTPIQSCLGRSNLSMSLKRAILEVIASKVASTPQDVDLYANCTLLAAGLKEKNNLGTYSFNSAHGDNPITSCVEFLHENEFIRLQTGEDGVTCFTPTPLGQACISASLSPNEALLLYKELERARECFVLENELHMLYQVTPFNVAEQWGNIDWLQVLALWEQLSADLKRVGELVGVEDRFIVRAMRGTININSEKQHMKLIIHRRFYVSLALLDLVNEVPISTVASKFSCSRGMLQSLQQSASTYAGMVTAFCHRLGWSSVELLIDQFQDRLHFGAHRDLLDLLKLSSLNGPRARALYNAGLTTIMELTTADVLTVENALHSAVPFMSDKERDGETALDTKHRRVLKGIWVTGRQGLSEREAAELIIEEARTAIQVELGVKSINWEKTKAQIKSSDTPTYHTSLQVAAVKEQEDSLSRHDCTQQDPPEHYNLIESRVKDDFPLVCENVSCVDLSKKLSTKVKCIVESLELKENSHSSVQELCDKSDTVTQKLLNSAESNKSEILNVQSMSLKSNSSKADVLNNGIHLLPKSSFKISSPECLNLEEGDVQALDNNLEKSQRPILDTLFDSAISNTALAALDYSNIQSSFRASGSYSNLNDGHLDSWCSTTSNQGGSPTLGNQQCFSERDNGKDLILAEERNSVPDTVNPCKQALEGVRRLSVDLFSVSPSEELSAAVGMSAATMSSNTTPVCSKIKLHLDTSSHSSRGRFSSPLLGKSPDILVSDRSPSLFGDSFEVDYNVLDAVATSAEHQAVLNENIDVENEVQELSEQASHYRDFKPSQTPNSVLSDSFVDVESILSQEMHQNSMSVKIDCEVNTKSGNNNSLTSEEPQKCLTEYNPRRGSSLYLGVRQRPIKRKKSKDIDDNSESVLGEVFQSAYDFQDTFSSKRILQYSKEESLDSAKSKCEAITNTVKIDRNSRTSNLVEYSVESPQKKSKLISLPNSDGIEDVVMSSQESAAPYERTLRKSSRVKKSVSQKNSTIRKIKENQTKVTKHKVSKIIGPSQSRTDLPRHQSKERIQTSGSDCISKTLRIRDESSDPFKTDSSENWNSFNIIDVCGNDSLFDCFVKTIPTTKSFSLSLACEKYQQDIDSYPKIGSKVMRRGFDHKKSSHIQHNDTSKFIFENLCLVGVSFCFGGTDAFFVSLKNDADKCRIPLLDRLNLIKNVLGCNSSKTSCTVCCFDLKEQFKVLYRCTGIDICPCISLYDPKVADWLLDPEGKEKNLQSMVLAYLKEATKLVAQVECGPGVGSPALDIEQTTPARKRASLEAILTWNLLQVQQKNMAESDVLYSFMQIEMPVLLCVVRMELSGITFDCGTAEALRDELVAKLEELQERCYSLAGRTFSLTSPADTSQVLYHELKLKLENVKKNLPKSTSKETLLKLKNAHPLPEVILLWRKMNAVLVKTVSPLLQPGSTNKIFGQYMFHTATGRLLMREPNLQNIPRDFDISLNSPQNFSLRSAFIPAKGKLFVAADYSQLELRLLGHLSHDSKLQNILNSDQDVFCSIAASWNNIPEELVTDQLRQKAKQICYGILYGMGISALAEQLEVSESEASILNDKFRSAYPGVWQFITDTIEFCRKNGHVKTLLGRHRKLPNIFSDNVHIRAHAERQAVNTTVQGSAADIVKSAMVQIEKALHECGENNTTSPQLVLHLHDELVYEVPEGLVSQFAELLQSKMENAISLSVKLPVKVKKGLSWGTLEKM